MDGDPLFVGLVDELTPSFPPKVRNVLETPILDNMVSLVGIGKIRAEEIDEA